MKKQKKVSVKIAYIIGVVEIAAMVILFLILNNSLTRILYNKSVQDMKVIAKDRAEIVDVYIADCVDYFNGYYKASEIREVLKHPDDPEYIKRATDFTKLFSEGYDDIEGLYVAQWDTYVLAHINPDSVNKTFRTPEKALELENMIKAEGKAFCTGIVQAPVTKKMVIPVYAPVYDTDGTPLGFAGAAFYADNLIVRLESLLTNNNSESGYSLINASNNIYIFDNNMSLAGTECTDRLKREAMSILRSGTHPENTYSFTDDNSITCCYYMEDRDWVFMIRDSKENIFGVIDTVRLILFVICLVIAVVLFIICRMAVDRQMIPLQAINDTIIRLQQNDFSKNNLIDAYCDRDDEFGNIALAVKDLHSVLESQYQLFQEMIEAQSVGTLVLAAKDEEIYFINQTAISLFGVADIPADRLTINDIRAKFEDDQNVFIKEQLDTIRKTNNEISFESVINQSGNKQLYLLAHAKGILLSNGDRVIIISLTDISDRKELENSLLILSETDFLTNICNRRSGIYRVEDCIKKEEYGMFCLFDVDKFKYVNDTFGHSAGDELLKEIARTMKKTFRTSDVIIRLGGDEFVVYATGIGDEPLAEKVLARFLNNISSMDIPELNGHHITISLGAVFVKEMTDFATVYEKADSLMYDCKKKQGNSYMFYDD
ncbi:MAG: sensor domain-containing diguanylate cyclase [Lachnospiraceae bacterium]|nr:sensor domain-containing diguanylate cyclase [Lachnospiraceae bacterium]